MPTYVYATVNKDGSLGETFELLQSMKDEPLTKHPETGKPVKRLLSAPNVCCSSSAASTSPSSSGHTCRGCCQH